ncbi:interleukin 12 receptor, beta 2a, like isoform X2 [Centropristis striata]|uniref:interleukin 12 receptor, beta 2a, like isoform X2 n=1 Tax=Centropristis striata TaxID=184440 RepID=UPI0027E129CB|nr:interleukin 12 receptor, beta 2a, like isoform X2 [Centropristis striata]
MAKLRTRWLLSILLVNLKNCSAPGPPAAPSRPYCFIPCGERNNCVDIHCSWDTRPDPLTPTNYSLHWEPANTEEGHVINGTSESGIIHREHFSHGELHVWVQAKNQHGSTRSQKAVFHTEDIMKPSPPNVSSSSLESLEIDWISSCDELQPCDVRHRHQAEQHWIEAKDVLHGSYAVDSPKPCTLYQFQVRCSCAKSLRSDWSATHTILSTETALVGALDVWLDCGISHTNSDCVLTWKLPPSQACGVFLGYEVLLSFSDGVTEWVNMSSTEPAGLLVCEEMQCYFNRSLKLVASVSVAAFNADSSTEPSHLTLTATGKERNDQPIQLQMTEESLNVSWDGGPSLRSEDLKEYVVQYKQAGSLLGRRFHWLRVNTSQTTATFTGEYKKYTPYQVSLFSVSHTREVHHLSSLIGYSVQGTPSTVPALKVSSIGSSHVILFWEPVPLSGQNGLILYYQVIVDSGKKQNVYNVSASPQHQNTTYELQHLSPEQDYEVRVRAVTAAGPGPNATAEFRTSHGEYFAFLLPAVLGILSVVVLCAAAALYCALCEENKACPLFFWEKVPDASNSQILKHMKNQINDPLAWISIPVYEPHPKISLLEVLEAPPSAPSSSPRRTSDPDGSTRPLVRDSPTEDQREDAVSGESHRTDRRYGREEYSKMLDSDEERDREDGWSSTEEEQSPSGYEKHFMPTAYEVQVV